MSSTVRLPQKDRAKECSGLDSSTLLVATVLSTVRMEASILPRVANNGAVDSAGSLDVSNVI